MGLDAFSLTYCDPELPIKVRVMTKMETETANTLSTSLRSNQCKYPMEMNFNWALSILLYSNLLREQLQKRYIHIQYTPSSSTICHIRL